MNKTVDITREELEKLRENRSHLFRTPNDRVLIKTRDYSKPLLDTNKYIDLCYWDKVKKEWAGILDIDKVPAKEKLRLGSLYKNTTVILFCETKDIDELVKLAKDEKAEVVKKAKELKNKFKDI